jgi:hypothetical protein
MVLHLLMSPQMRMDTMTTLPQYRKPRRRALAAVTVGSTLIDCKDWRRHVPVRLDPPVIPHHPPLPPPLKRRLV